MRPRPVTITLTLLSALVLALPVAQPLLAVQAPRPAQQKPFTQDQVQGMVRDGLGDETGAKALEQRGNEFDPGMSQSWVATRSIQ
jgi:hypothetical protein